MKKMAALFTESMREQGVYEEYFDGESLVYMATPSNTEADFCALEKAISHAFSVLPRVSPGRATPAADAQELPLPQVKCRLREAFFSTNRLTLPVEESAGCIMAGLYAPCPPGVPLVMPGEAISCAHAARLSGGGILQVDVLK